MKSVPFGNHSEISSYSGNEIFTQIEIQSQNAYVTTIEFQLFGTRHFIKS